MSETETPYLGEGDEAQRLLLIMEACPVCRPMTQAMLDVVAASPDDASGYLALEPCVSCVRALEQDGTGTAH